MLKQISIQEALDRYLNGKLVPAMVPSESGDWEEMDLITLNGLLDNLILFGDFDENYVEESTQEALAILDLHDKVIGGAPDGK